PNQHMSDTSWRVPLRWSLASETLKRIYRPHTLHPFHEGLHGDEGQGALTHVRSRSDCARKSYEYSGTLKVSPPSTSKRHLLRVHQLPKKRCVLPSIPSGGLHFEQAELRYPNAA